MTVNESYFPFPKMRDQQKLVLDKIKNSNKKAIILQCGTGTGKSAIGYTIARSCKGRALMVTPTKQLQDQYVHDFESLGLTELKGLGSYPCIKADCAYPMGPCHSVKGFKCDKEEVCPYKLAFDEAVNSKVTVVNYSWLCANATRASKGKSLINEAEVIIFDEAHNVEAQLCSAYSFEICPTEFYNYYYQGETITPAHKKLLDAFDKAKDINSATMGFLMFYKDIIRPKIEEMDKDENPDQDYWAYLSNNLDKMKYFCKRHKDHPNDKWCVTVSLNEGMPMFVFEPLYVDDIYDEIISTSDRKVVFMSATILDPKTYAESIGLKEEYDYIDYDSPFDPEKSPIICGVDIDCSYKGFTAAEQKKLLEAVQQIVDLHPNEKGIIHTGNQNITKLLKKLKNPRFLIREGANTNDVIMDKHINSTEPTILVSSSMMEGVDLKGDLARFQIICKMPYPSLVNERIKTKAGISYSWYNLQTWYRLLQATGRATRSEEDYSKTYILDKAFTREYKKYHEHLPEQFNERIYSIGA